jgi:hypothetical protein
MSSKNSSLKIRFNLEALEVINREVSSTASVEPSKDETSYKTTVEDIRSQCPLFKDMPGNLTVKVQNGNKFDLTAI